MKGRKKLNKKGSIDDLFFVMGFVVTIGLLSLIGFKVIGEFSDEVDKVDAFGQDSKTAVSEVESKFPGVIDNTFLLLTVGLCVAVLAMAALVRIHPVFFVFYIILMPTVIFLSGVFSGIYQEAAESAAFIEQAQQLTFMTNIITYLPIIIGVVGFIMAVLMYSAWKQDQ